LGFSLFRILISSLGSAITFSAWRSNYLSADGKTILWIAMNDDNKTKALERIVYLIILVAFLGAVFNIPSALTNMAIQWLIGMFVGSLLSWVAGELVEAFTGDLLKKITLTVKIRDFHFSITAFAIATFIVKVWLFGF
jgi:hypothetical protein